MNFENIKLIHKAIVEELESNKYPKISNLLLDNMNKLKECIEDEFPYVFDSIIEIKSLTPASYLEDEFIFQYKVIEICHFGGYKEIIKGIEVIDIDESWDVFEEAAKHIQRNMKKYLSLPNINECSKLTNYLCEACAENECGVFVIPYTEDISIPGVCENKDEFLEELKLLEEDCKKYDVKEIDIESNGNWVECYVGFPTHFNMAEKE